MIVLFVSVSLVLLFNRANALSEKRLLEQPSVELSTQNIGLPVLNNKYKSIELGFRYLTCG